MVDLSNGVAVAMNNFNVRNFLISEYFSFDVFVIMIVNLFTLYSINVIVFLQRT